MVPIQLPIEILSLPIANILSVWLFGLSIGRTLAGPYLSRHGKTLNSGRTFLICVGVAAMPLCLVAGFKAIHFCYSFMEYPPFRIEPANFAGGPSKRQAMLALSLASMCQLFLAVCIWLIAFRLFASPSTAATHRTQANLNCQALPLRGPE